MLYLFNFAAFLKTLTSVKDKKQPLKHSSFYLICITFASLNSKTENIMAKDINRLKVVLAEKKKTNKWLAEQLGKDPATVSKWCTNASQPSIETLLEIARVLQVDIKDLLQSTAQDPNMVYVKIPKGGVLV